MSQTLTTPDHTALFGSIAFGSIFVAPADADRARAVFRALRIRPSHEMLTEVNAFGIGKGAPALLFGVSDAAQRKLLDAGAFDPERHIGGGL